MKPKKRVALTAAKREAIKNALGTGKSYKAIGLELGVSTASVGRIARAKTPKMPPRVRPPKRGTPNLTSIVEKALARVAQEEDLTVVLPRDLLADLGSTAKANHVDINVFVAAVIREALAR